MLRTPSANDTFGCQPSSVLILVMSAQVQSGSPGRLSMCTVSVAPSNRTSSLTLTGAPVSVNELVRLLGVTETVHIDKRPGEPDCTWADITKIRTELGWQPKVSFADGVRSMLDHIDYWRDAPVWTVDGIAEATRDWFRQLSPSEVS